MTHSPVVHHFFRKYCCKTCSFLVIRADNYCVPCYRNRPRWWCPSWHADSNLWTNQQTGAENWCWSHNPSQKSWGNHGRKTPCKFLGYLLSLWSKNFRIFFLTAHTHNDHSKRSDHKRLLFIKGSLSAISPHKVHIPWRYVYIHMYQKWCTSIPVL